MRVFLLELSLPFSLTHLNSLVFLLLGSLTGVPRVSKGYWRPARLMIRFWESRAGSWADPRTRLLEDSSAVLLPDSRNSIFIVISNLRLALSFGDVAVVIKQIILLFTRLLRHPVQKDEIVGDLFSGLVHVYLVAMLVHLFCFSEQRCWGLRNHRQRHFRLLQIQSARGHQRLWYAHLNALSVGHVSLALLLHSHFEVFVFRLLLESDLRLEKRLVHFLFILNYRFINPVELHHWRPLGALDCFPKVVRVPILRVEGLLAFDGQACLLIHCFRHVAQVIPHFGVRRINVCFFVV